MGFEYNVIALPFIFTGAVVLLGLVYAGVHRYLKHKERMAMIEKGLVPSDEADTASDARPSGRSNVSRGLTTTFVGLAITLGMLTIGVGPWLLGGLIPMAVGIGQLIGHYVSDENENGRGLD